MMLTTEADGPSVLCQRGFVCCGTEDPWIPDICVTPLWEPAQSPQVPIHPWLSAFFLLQG